MRSKATAVMVNYRKLVNVDNFDQWTWDELVAAARQATEMRNRINEIVTSTHGDYIARLTISKAVKRGGLKEFCEETGLNYGTVRNWRSEYLTKEQLRQYRLKEPEPEPESEPEPENIVILNDNSHETDSAPVFEDMFDGSIKSFDEVSETFVGQHEIQAQLHQLTLLRSKIESAISHHTGETIDSIIVYFKNGGMIEVIGTDE